MGTFNMGEHLHRSYEDYYRKARQNGKHDDMLDAMAYAARDIASTQYMVKNFTCQCRVCPEIKRVIFNDPATIVIWSDDTKTIVKAAKEQFDPEKGLAMAIVKKLYDGTPYYRMMKSLIPEDAYPKYEIGIDLASEPDVSAMNDHGKMPKRSGRYPWGVEKTTFENFARERLNAKTELYVTMAERLFEFLAQDIAIERMIQAVEEGSTPFESIAVKLENYIQASPGQCRASAKDHKLINEMIEYILAPYGFEPVLVGKTRKQRKIKTFSGSKDDYTYFHSGWVFKRVGEEQ